jgi:hypothetical protein
MVDIDLRGSEKTQYKNKIRFMPTGWKEIEEI